MIVASVAGALGALAALAIPLAAPGPVLAAVAGFVLLLVAMGLTNRRSMTGIPPILEPRFPSPGNEL